MSQLPIPPTRGLIYDRNGILIADNRPVYSLTIVRERIKDFPATIEYLKRLIGITDDEVNRYKHRIQRAQLPYEAIPLRDSLNAEEIAKISVNRYQLSGVAVEARLMRHYPLGASTAHSVGYVSSITRQEQENLDTKNYKASLYIGKSGVEKFYENVLHGTIGSRTVEKNASGRILKESAISYPTPGNNIVLHLDSDLQIKAERILEDYRAGMVAIEPESGGILAIVSKPSFDPNLFVTGISRKTYKALRNSMDKPMFNRALNGQYPPGSTIKPFLALAALDAGVVNYTTKIFDPGWYKLKNSTRRYHNWTWWVNKTGHGWVELQRAIYQSNDVYFYDLAKKMGIDRMHNHLQHYGFGINSTIDIPEAKKGLLPSTAWKLKAKKQSWYPGETLSAGIGQGYMLFTPLQLATAASIVANKGKWIKPRLLILLCHI